MKLTKWIYGKSENGNGDEGIVLNGGENKIVSVVKTNEGIKFTEECDGYYCETFTKQEALIIVDELKKWIENEY